MIICFFKVFSILSMSIQNKIFTYYLSYLYLRLIYGKTTLNIKEFYLILRVYYSRGCYIIILLLQRDCYIIFLKLIDYVGIVIVKGSQSIIYFSYITLFLHFRAL